ncbi:isocitrate lyase/phosphoenolpyruvate mutase family protein [Caulobacter segnis]|uniref:isocitrate lyase/PEP mutase family protein n=1 Tax=Caulobacter segnis TaxID=88688 RepID=UPI00241027E1|nr:isocitrate lyase/phosphoenolpyruvate mutase family protein [Caulobacter segnis]MDG2523615.1 isocitrate lyase/phosphoenolpyruvate mutase family protein [Caulobacter segnis]
MTAAADFRRLHQDGLLILPNAWDAGSARLIESLGARAIATTSCGVAWSHGYRDGDQMPLAPLLHTVKTIARAVSVPFTIDMESGYGATAREVAEAVVAVAAEGAAGINIEDGIIGPGEAALRIETIREALVKRGLDLFINARTDVYLRGLAPKGEQVALSLGRASVYRDAGADGLFTPGVVDLEEIAALAKDSPLPLNVMARPGLPGAAELAKLGVRRLSAGGAISEVVYTHVARLAGGFLKDGVSDAVTADAMPYPAINALMPEA